MSLKNISLLNTIVDIEENLLCFRFQLFDFPEVVLCKLYGDCVVQYDIYGILQ